MANILVKFLSFVLLSSVLFLYLDINRSGSLELSKTGQFLRQQGLLVHVKPYYVKLERQLKVLRTWLLQICPTYDDVQYVTLKLCNVIYEHAVNITTFIKKKGTEVIDFVMPYIPPDWLEQIKKYIMDLFYITIEMLYNLSEYVHSVIDGFYQFLLENNIIGINWKQQTIKNVGDFGKTAYVYINKVSQWLYMNTLYYFQ